MANLTVDGGAPISVPDGKRLVLALTDDAKVDQLHACGGGAHCTTCRVQFVSGEPTSITEAEKNLLTAKGLAGTAGLRLSCQIECRGDMSVKIISRFAGSGRKDSGQRPADAIEPPPVWQTR